MTPDFTQHAPGKEGMRRHLKLLMKLLEDGKLHSFATIATIEMGGGQMEARGDLMGCTQCRPVLARWMIRMAMALLGGSAPVLKLVPIIESSPEKSQPTMH